MRAGEEAARRSLESQAREAVQQLAAFDRGSGRNARRNHPARRSRHGAAGHRNCPARAAPRALRRCSALEALIRAALEKLQSQEVYRVRVHPDQERFVRACLRTDRPRPGCRGGDRSRRSPAAERFSKSAAAPWMLPWRLSSPRSSAVSSTNWRRVHDNPATDRSASLHCRRTELRTAAVDRRSGRARGSC